MTQKISVIGLGKLGASMLAGFASRGFHVIGVDTKRKVVDLINSGLAPVEETNLGELLSSNKDRITATLRFDSAIIGSDVTFVIVPTPSLENGAFSNAYVAEALREIGLALKEKQGYHLVVITSTVLPGATRNVLLPILEQSSGKKCGLDFGLCYSPEFIALGTVIRDFLNPDFYLVGEFDKKSGDLLESINKQVSSNDAPSKRMSLENAELAKIAINSFVTLKISFANMLSKICEGLPSGDIDAVSDALGMDSRIGRKYLSGGLGYGGPCFPRDNLALSFIGERLGSNCQIALSNNQFNKSIATSFVSEIKPYISSRSKVGILGLAYKPLSHVVEESASIELAKALISIGLQVSGFDPLANDAARAALGDSAVIHDDMSDLLNSAEIILVATPDDIFKKITPEEILRGKDKVIVFDFWRILKSKISNHDGITYIAGGVCSDSNAASNRLASLWSQT